MADWATRSAAAGVIGAWKPTTIADLGGHFDDESYASRFGITPATGGAYTQVVDTTEGCSAPGALRFQFPSQSAGNPGSFGFRLAADNTKLFGIASELPGKTVYNRLVTQARVKWNAAMAAQFFNRDGGGQQAGIKFFDTAGSFPLGIDADPDSTGTSSAEKCVVQTYFQTKIFHAYQYGYDRATHTEIVTRALAADQAVNNGNLQNVRGTPYCDYPDYLNCLTMVGDQWVTLKLDQQIIGRNATWTDMVDVEVQLYIQFGGGASVKIIDWKTTTPGYTPRLWPVGWATGVIYLFPYMTDKDPLQIHPTCYIYYDELIVSSQDIADADAPVIITPNPRLSRSRIRRIS